MKRILIIGILILVLFITGCDSSSSVITNQTFINAQYVSESSKLIGKATYYYITVIYDDKKIEFEIDSNDYDSLKQLRESSLILNNKNNLKVNIIADTENKVKGIALASK